MRIVTTRMILLACCLLIAPAKACGIQVADPSNDHEPPGLPGTYDLLGLDVTSDGMNITWTWTVASLDNSSGSVHLWGQFDTSESDPANSFHPYCLFMTTTPVLPEAPECGIAKSTAYGNEAGSPVTFEVVSELNGTVSDGVVTVAFPASLADLSGGGLLVGLHASIQLAITEPNVVPGFGGSVTPIVTDHLEAGDQFLAVLPCAQEEAVSGDDDAIVLATPVESGAETGVKDVPAFGAMTLAAALLVAALGRQLAR